MFTPWKGGQCPVEPDTLVRIQIRCRTPDSVRDQTPTPARHWSWKHRNEAGDVVGYEVAA